MYLDQVKCYIITMREHAHVRQAAVVEVHSGLVLEYVAPCWNNVPHVRRHERVAHQRPFGEAHAGAVASDKGACMRGLGERVEGGGARGGRCEEGKRRAGKQLSYH